MTEEMPGTHKTERSFAPITVPKGRSGCACRLPPVTRGDLAGEVVARIHECLLDGEEGWVVSRGG